AIIVELQCDYCGKKFNRMYSDHTLIRNRDIVHKDACEGCRDYKSKEVMNYKQSVGLLTKKDNGYWTFKENRLKELNLFLKKYGSADYLYSKSKEGKTVWLHFNRNNHSIVE